MVSAWASGFEGSIQYSTKRGNSSPALSAVSMASPRADLPSAPHESQMTVPSGITAFLGITTIPSRM
jgi:hypothetical protein